jgi:hypothetical protein
MPNGQDVEHHEIPRKHGSRVGREESMEEHSVGGDVKKTGDGNMVRLLVCASSDVGT